MTTKKQPPARQYLNKEMRQFFPCELTPGSTIQIDEYTKGTGESTIVFCTTGDRPPLVCKVRCVHAIHDTTKIHYLVETDIEYNEREKKTLRHDYHVFSIAYVNKIVERINAPVRYKWFRPLRYLYKDMVDILFALAPHYQFYLPKVSKFLEEKGFFNYRNCDYFYNDGFKCRLKPKHKKKLKKFLKKNINRLKAFKYPVISEYVDDSHGLTTDDGYDGYIDYNC